MRFSHGSKRPLRQQFRPLARTISKGAIVLIAAGMTSPAISRTIRPLYTVRDCGPSFVRTLVNTPGLNRHGDLAIWHLAGTNNIQGRIIHGLQITEVSGDEVYPLVYPSDISDDRTVVGSLQKSQDLRFTQAFRWSRGRLELLQALGGRYATTTAINSSGDIVGSAETSGGNRHAVVWHAKLPKDLGLLRGGDYSSARDINDMGDIVGEANIAQNGKPHAFLWQRGQMRQLLDMVGSKFCSAQALNNRGDIVGSCDLPNGAAHAMLWRDGRIEDLGTLGDDDAPSTALDVNASTQVVGSSEVVDGKLRAFLWCQGKMLDLNTVLAPGSGWLLLVASRINDRGEIAGRGFYHGSIHAFILRPVNVL